MISIASLGASICSKQITIRGQVLTVRPIPSGIETAIAAAFPGPRAPLTRDPTRGSLAEPIPDLQDSNYRNAVRSWNANTAAAQAIMATGIETTDAKPGSPEWSTWLLAKSAELRDALSGDEIGSINRAVEDAIKAATSGADSLTKN